MQYIGRYTIPTWAIAAIENADFSGLDDMDTELVQAFIDATCKGGYYVEWVGIDNPYFSRYPDIGGLASEVIDADFYH
mgnify:FL=1